MKYDFNRLDSKSWEHLIQSISKYIIGPGVTTFGAGPDGGREATYDGQAPYPSLTSQWEGHWVIQAKFKTAVLPDEIKDFNWVKSELEKELDKYDTRKIKVQKPDNYILFTNVILTATAGTGGLDRAKALQEHFQKKYSIKNVKIVSQDDVTGFLDGNRDIATAYAPFILPGDVLFKILHFLNEADARNKIITDWIHTFLEIEFIENMSSKLGQSGNLTDRKISLQKVFIDLSTKSTDPNARANTKFIEFIISLGNNILKGESKPKSRFVLIGGPGYGKSTLTQYLAQIYRAHFILSFDNATNNDAANFKIEYQLSVRASPKWNRFPFRITLKEYAAWIKETSDLNSTNPILVLEYIRSVINKKTGGNLNITEVETFITNLPCVFIFDGLDEVPTSSNRGQVLNEINLFADTFLRRSDTDSVIICTTRPQGYSDEFGRAKYEHKVIEDLTVDECKQYLNRLVEQIIESSNDKKNIIEILNRALSEPVISRLMKSPLQASIMTILVKSGGEPPRNRFDLFTDYYDTIFKREKQTAVWEVLSGNPKYVQDIHDTLGIYLQSISESNANPSATITLDGFNLLVKSYLKTKHLDDGDINRIAYEIVHASTDRLVFISEVEDQKISFAIRSLQEFFAARGYIHNKPDQLLRERLKMISKSAYWNNTLLFAIGYISKNRDYYVPVIESICNELNGSAIDIEDSELHAIPKMGSWLALQIVNEGTFRSSPNEENKFCHLIQHLFDIAPNRRHQELSQLPEKIISKWILRFIEDALTKSSLNYSAWAACIHLYDQFLEVKGIIVRKMPTDSLEKLEIVKFFIHNKKSCPEIVEAFISCVAIVPFSNLNWLFDTSIYNQFMVELGKTDKIYKNEKVRILEFAFLSCLIDPTEQSIQLLDALGGQIHRSDHESLPNSLYSTNADLKITSQFSFIIRIPLGTPSATLDSIHNFAIREGSNSSVMICDFLKNPSYTNYTKLKKLLNTLPGDHRSYIEKCLRRCTYISKTAFEKEETVGEENYLALLAIKDVNFSNVTSRQRLGLNAYSWERTIVQSNDINTLDEFVKTYINDDPSLLAMQEYFRLFSWIHSITDKRDEMIAFEKNNNLFHRSIDAGVKKGAFNFSEVQTIFSFLSLEELTDLQANPQASKAFNETYSQIHGQWLGAPLRYEFLSAATIKMSEFLKVQVLLGKRPIYKMLLYQLLFVLETGSNLDFTLVPFDSVKKGETSDDDDLYRCILLLLDREITQADSKMICETFREKYNASNSEINDLLMTALRFSINNEHVDRVLKDLSPLINKSNVKLRSEFENHVMTYTSSKGANVEIASWK